MMTPKPPTKEQITTAYQNSLRLQASLLKALDQIKNEDTKELHNHLAAADGHIERISAELSNIRVNHTVS